MASPELVQASLPVKTGLADKALVNQTALERLAEQACVCTRCRNSLTRTNVVLGEGAFDTPLVIVGEGPGDNEDKTGRPFVGRAGQLLDQCLLENKITRRHVYI